MKNKVTSEDLSAFYDGDAAGSVQGQEHVAHRLRVDAEVQKRYLAYGKLSALLASLPEPAVNPNFAGNVIRAIEARRERRVASWWSSVLTPLATAAAFVFFAGFAALFVMTSTPVTVPEMAATENVSVETPSTMTLASVLEETYAARRDGSVQGDSSWLFDTHTSATVESADQTPADELLLALSKVEFFDHAVSKPMVTDRDLPATLAGMDAGAARMFVLLLNDYAQSGESL